MKNILIRSELSLNLRMRMIRCYIFSVLLYGCKSWTLDPSSEERIDAFEMHLYRRMLRLSWIQKITNEEVLRRMDKRKELMNAVMQRKTLYFGHIMRGQRYSILRLLLEGKVEGKRSIGRRQNSWLKDLRRWFEIFRAAVSRTTLVMRIANLRREGAN